MFNIYMNQKVCAILLITRENKDAANMLIVHHTLTFSLVHIVAVYAPLGPDGLERIVQEFECVHILPAMLRTRPGLGQKVITVCAGYATICDGSLPVQPRWRYGVSRCVPKSHSSAPYTVAKPGVTVSSPWTQLMSVYYTFTWLSYGGDTDHAERATVMPQKKPALIRTHRAPGILPGNQFPVQHGLSRFNAVPAGAATVWSRQTPVSTLQRRRGGKPGQCERGCRQSD